MRMCTFLHSWVELERDDVIDEETYWVRDGNREAAPVHRREIGRTVGECYDTFLVDQNRAWVPVVRIGRAQRRDLFPETVPAFPLIPAGDRMLIRNAIPADNAVSVYIEDHEFVNPPEPRKPWENPPNKPKIPMNKMYSKPLPLP